MEIYIPSIVKEICAKESKLSFDKSNLIEDSIQMIEFLHNMLVSVKNDIIKNGFADKNLEINFFKNIKPNLLGKLFYYNKIFRIETSCPVMEGEISDRYYMKHLKELNNSFRKNIKGSGFYRYYRSGRTDQDDIYFTLGNINYKEGLNNSAFEIDPQFSTYYDVKIAHILSNDLLHSYLLENITTNKEFGMTESHSAKQYSWTSSKNALVELTYALYASRSICNGNIELRKLGLITNILFGISLNDMHHAFHRMKTRSGSRTAFLDQLKISLEDYMDKEI